MRMEEPAKRRQKAVVRIRVSAGKRSAEQPGPSGIQRHLTAGLFEVFPRSHR